MFLPIIELATKYRSDTKRKGGFVIIYGQQAVAWCEVIQYPRHWEPGCYAVSVDGDIYRTLGGTPEIGANEWILVLGSELTAAVYAKSRGLKKMRLMCEVSDQSETNLQNWFKHKRKLFDCILVAALELQSEKRNKDS